MQHAEDRKIADEVLEDFASFAAIPRPSLHEKAISDYLLDAFHALGCNVVQDASYNIIADREATPGFEDVPRVILQAHMDMVCVAAEGVVYDPLHDPIRLRKTGDKLSAEGTSLGADDGAGIAMILYVFRHAKNVGPLRAIITTDEETGMTGAQALDANALADADFLINWDSENYDSLTRGCAGSVSIEFHRKISRRETPEGSAWRLSINGLLGGHSGERIGDGRGNALRILAQTLHALKNAGISISVSSMSGGSARNAIASEADAVIVTQAEKADILRVIAEVEQRARIILKNVDSALQITLSETEPPARILSDADAKAITDALLLLHTGVYQMSTTMPGLVETSANLGLLRIEKNELWFSYFARSSIDEKLTELVDSCRILGQRLGLEAEIGTPSPGWRERPKSALSDLMTKIFEMQTGRPMHVEVIHAGLECGWHIKKAPQLDMVSIGVTTHDIHSPQETLDITTIAPQVRLVMESLRQIADGKCGGK